MYIRGTSETIARILLLLLLLLIIIINVFISPVKIHKKVTESESIEIMKIVQVIYNYNIKHD